MKHAEAKPRPPRHVAGVVLVVVVAAAVGVLAGVAVAGAARVNVTAGAQALTSVPASVQSYDGHRTVGASFDTSPDENLVVNRAGVVTAVGVASGQGITSGSVVLMVESQPVVALATSIPLYRDLSSGDSGPDVAALQAELITLGFLHGTADGRFGAGTRDAIVALKQSLGFPGGKDGTFALSWYAWLPSTPFIANTVDVRVGNRVDTGSAIVTQSGMLSRVVLDPGVDFTTGDHTWQADLFGLTVPTDGFSITDPESLALLSATSDYQHLSKVTGGLDGMTAVLHYDSSVALLRVPPAALFSIDGSRACLASSGDVRPVTIVYSSLSGTLVDASGWTPAAVDVGSALTGLRCPG